MTQFPDFMPVLSAGAHESPAEGACAMELASILAGESFSDQPRCADPTLAAMVRAANDTMGDHERQLLIPFITRVLNTRILDEQFAEQVWSRLGETFIPGTTSWDVSIWGGPRVGDWFNPRRWVDDAWGHPDGTAEVLRRMTEVFDAFDELTGHKPQENVDLAALEQRRRELAAA